MHNIGSSKINFTIQTRFCSSGKSNLEWQIFAKIFNSCCALFDSISPNQLMQWKISSTTHQPCFYTGGKTVLFEKHCEPVIFLGVFQKYSFVNMLLRTRRKTSFSENIFLFCKELSSKIPNIPSKIPNTSSNDGVPKSHN